MRREAAEYAIEAMTEREPMRTWIIDDTGFPKQGTHSVGVQRQYTGTTGKISNCQIGVSLSIATRSAHVPIDCRAVSSGRAGRADAARRDECKIPDEVVFKTKEDLALDMIVRAAEDKVPGDIVLVWPTVAYGRSYDFRETVQRARLRRYALGISPTQTMWVLDARDRCSGDAKAARTIASELGKKAFRRVTWRNGSMQGRRGKLSSRFALARLKVAHDDGRELERREPLWLLIEWPDGEAAPTKYALTTVPRTMSKKQLVRLFKERYRTERVYEEMKGAASGARPLRRAASSAGITTSPSPSAATPSSSRSVCGIFPPRPDGPVPLVRTPSRPERHFADSFVTIRLAIARILACWLPRCPLCYRLLIERGTFLIAPASRARQTEKRRSSAFGDLPPIVNLVVFCCCSSLRCRGREYHRPRPCQSPYPCAAAPHHPTSNAPCGSTTSKASRPYSKKPGHWGAPTLSLRVARSIAAGNFSKRQSSFLPPETLSGHSQVSGTVFNTRDGCRSRFGLELRAARHDPGAGRISRGQQQAARRPRRC